jgi:ADP-heptose:LPS heptosyltransferase
MAIEKVGTVFDIRNAIQKLKPDLLVDLSGSSKSFLQTSMLAKKTLHYKKQDSAMHAVHNYLDTISSLALKPADEEIFPTLFISDDEKDKIRKIVAARENRRLLAIVPGVGPHRPHRAWPEDNWVGLGKNILWEKDHAVIILGGPDDRTLCSRIAEKVGDYCFNLAGKLTLPETAAALSL